MAGPVPTIVALVGWVYIYLSGTLAVDRAVACAGSPSAPLAFLIYARAEHTWPFGPKEVKEAFADGASSTLERQKGGGSAW